MGTTGCNEFLAQLDRWMEGERPSEGRSHLRDCPQCRALVDDLGAIHETARSLVIADADPPTRVWISLREQLVTEGLIHGERRGWTGHLKTWLDEVFSAVPRPALAGAYLVALIAVGFALAGPARISLSEDPWISGMQSSTQPLSAQLDNDEQHTVSALPDSDPVVTASLHKNLAIVDNYIALCEKSVHEDPENEMARDFLYDAYQQKADLIAQMTERGGAGQ